jgi:hypothetical protein
MKRLFPKSAFGAQWVILAGCLGSLGIAIGLSLSKPKEGASEDVTRLPAASADVPAKDANPPARLPETIDLSKAFAPAREEAPQVLPAGFGLRPNEDLLATLTGGPAITLRPTVVPHEPVRFVPGAEVP